MYKFTKEQQEQIRREALRLRVRPVVIELVVIARNITVGAAVQVIERELNKQRESGFDF